MDGESDFMSDLLTPCITECLCTDKH